MYMNKIEHGSDKTQKISKKILFIFTNLVLLFYPHKIWQEFRETNFSALRKITKKHDKMTNRETGAAWMKSDVTSSALKDDKHLTQLKDEIEVLNSCPYHMANNHPSSVPRE